MLKSIKQWFSRKEKEVVPFNDVCVGDLPEIGEKPMKTIGDLIKKQVERGTVWKDPQQSKEDVG